MNKSLFPFCECGCGGRVTKKGNRFIHGHNKSMLGKNHSLKTKELLSIITAKQFSTQEDRDKQSIRLKKYYRNPDNKNKNRDSQLKPKDPLPDSWEIDKDSKMVTNKNSSLYFGVVIAEQVLIKTFKDVKRMPNGNHGYDFICNKDKKIDSKSSASGHKGFWQFQIKQNEIADYFICLAFENRDDLTPIHLWLIPGKDINHLTSAVIHKSTISKWKQYEQPLDRILACCNKMKGEQ
jgi:hypothetical protein